MNSSAFVLKCYMPLPAHVFFTETANSGDVQQLVYQMQLPYLCKQRAKVPPQIKNYGTKLHRREMIACI